ncbi:MAG: asparagine synthase (glutamine-hydrolyzing) [Myxococcota bacterium]
MCGIAGIASLGSAPIAPETIKNMCDVLAHRGPDDAGYAYFRISDGDPRKGGYWVQFADPKFAHLSEHLPSYGGTYFQDEVQKQRFSLAFGHRRLSIIDLSHYGHQPMASSNHRFWLTYNGEIYNYRELRETLVKKGYVFRTRTDSEVLLHLYEEEGVDGFRALNGMFAFAIYDSRENDLILCRDRFGVKPLYYAQGATHFAFASEPKAILKSGAIESRFDPGALAEYFTFQNIFGSDTLFEHVRMLEPGHVLRLKPQLGKVEAPRSYLPPFPSVDPRLVDAKQLQAEVAERFRAAVQRQLISDVEVGAYLSGGMDSGSIVAVAGRSIPRLLTFTGGFDLTNVNGIEQGFDERKNAEKLSYLLQTEHYDVVLHAGDMPAVMEKLSWHMDDPRVGMCHQNWYVAKLASKFVKVCLAGAGGDELFGGYPWRYRPALTASSVGEFDEAYFRYWHRLLGPEELPGLFAPALRERLPKVRESFERVMAGAPAFVDGLSLADNLLARAFHFEMKTFLHGFLVTEDHISMAHSLETRVPFLDNDLADLAFRLPPALKLATDPMSDRASLTAEHLISADGKRILREAMSEILPREFVQQKKQGFSPPDENWFRGPSMDYIQAILSDPRARQRPWLDDKFYAAKLEEHFSGRRNHRLLIWSLLSVEWLARHYLDAGGALHGSSTLRS